MPGGNGFFTDKCGGELGAPSGDVRLVWRPSRPALGLPVVRVPGVESDDGAALTPFKASDTESLDNGTSIAAIGAIVDRIGPSDPRFRLLGVHRGIVTRARSRDDQPGTTWMSTPAAAMRSSSAGSAVASVTRVWISERSATFARVTRPTFDPSATTMTC